jgi:hypothetical protein
MRIRLPLPTKHTLTANAGCESRSESAGGDQLPLVTLELMLSLRSRRLLGVDDDDDDEHDDDDDPRDS